MSGGPLSINLREKFKLLRQWQIQQQEDFLRKQIEYKQQTLQNEKKINPLLLSRPREIDVENEDKNEENRAYSEEEEYDAVQNRRSEREDNINLGFMQRMSPGSLQKALSGALVDIEVDRADKTAAIDLKDQDGAFQDIESAEEYSEVDIEDNYETSDANLWDKSTEMQTVVFKPKQSSDDKVVTEEVMSSASSLAGSLNELDGVYPIVYSEDNVSENEDKEEESQNLSIEAQITPMASDIINGAVPFDERPAKSKIGNEITSFEELIEKQLQIDHENNKKAQISQKQDKSRKPFLRKGDGIARFGKNSSKFGSSSVRRIPEKSNTLPNAAKGLPKTSLKLVPDVKPRGYPISAGNPKENVPKTGERSKFEDEEEMLSHPAIKSSAIKGKDISRESATQKEFNTHASPDSSIEASFQKMLLKSNAREKVDDEELEEFELLEEAAADTSLSSNASVVVRMMSKASSSVNTRAQNVTSSPLQKPIYQAKRERKTSPRSYENHSLSVNIEDSDEDDDVESYLANDIPDLMKSRVPNSNDLSDIKENDEHAMTSVEFHDQSAWGDTTQSTDDFESTITESPNAKPIKNRSPRQESPPPTSNLMKQFFPNLQKEKATRKEIIKETNDREEMNNMKNDNKRSPVVNSSEQISTENASDILKIKLKELEDEITRFKQENANLERVKIEREKELSNLRAEVERFQKQRSEELERIEKFKDEEMRKIKRERKLFEKYQKEARTIPNKKDREEIESLKQQIEDLQDELKRRDTRWNGSAARFRKRIEDVENENHELKENLKLLEKERLQRWSKREQMSGESQLKSKHVTDQTMRSNNKADDIQKSNFSKRETSSLETAVKNQKNIAESLREHDQQIYKEEIVNSLRTRKLELSPRSDVVPQEQPPTPRKSNSKNTAFIEKSTQRLSLTPEKHGTTQEKHDSGMRYSDGKVERILSNGSREITFPNGTRKTIDPTNQSVVISFFNGDMKQILADERVVYYYAESKTTHTTCKDGLEIFEFSNGQVEKHYPNGRKEIIYPDKTVKCIFVNGAEETVFADGTIQNLDVNGERTISFPNGQREIHTQHYKRREYPDGTMKTVYQDGRQETRYASGRLRIKDPNGNVIVDTGIA